MNRTQRHKTASVIAENRLSAIVRTQDESLAREAMQAAVAGGFRLVEFTLTTPNALGLIESFRGNADLTVGAGTVMSADQARQAVEAGAQFLVSPICDPEVLAAAALLDVPMIPGASTPTEMERAHRLGADFVKLFPAPAGGVNFVRAVLGPQPHLRIFPTSGVDPENFIDFLEAGCAGAGFVASLFTPEDMANSRFHAIEQRAEMIFQKLRTWLSARSSE